MDRPCFVHDRDHGLLYRVLTRDNSNTAHCPGPGSGTKKLTQKTSVPTHVQATKLAEFISALPCTSSDSARVTVEGTKLWAGLNGGLFSETMDFLRQS